MKPYLRNLLILLLLFLAGKNAYSQIQFEATFFADGKEDHGATLRFAHPKFTADNSSFSNINGVHIVKSSLNINPRFIYLPTCPNGKQESKIAITINKETKALELHCNSNRSKLLIKQKLILNGRIVTKKKRVKNGSFSTIIYK